MWRKNCRAICNLLNRIHKTGVILSIVIFNITLVACSSENSTGQINNSNMIQETEETEETEEKEQIVTEDDEEINELNEKVEISMEKSIEIGAKEAEKYYDNLKLTVERHAPIAVNDDLIRYDFS